MRRGARILVPEIADYEVRRELPRAGKTESVSRLDAFNAAEPRRYVPLSTAAMRKAAELWAAIRGQGQPTAPDPAFDCDVILAAQAVTSGYDLAFHRPTLSLRVRIPAAHVSDLFTSAPSKLTADSAQANWNGACPTRRYNPVMRRRYFAFNGKKFQFQADLDLTANFMDFILAHGDEALQAFNQMELDPEQSELLQQLLDQGLLEKIRGRWRLTPRAINAMQRKALMEVFAQLKKGTREGHPSPDLGGGGERVEGTRPYQFGDAVSELDFAATLKNTIGRMTAENAEFRMQNAETPRTAPAAASAAELSALSIHHSALNRLPLVRESFLAPDSRESFPANPPATSDAAGEDSGQFGNEKGFSFQQSIQNPKSAINLQSEIRNPQSAGRPQSKIQIPKSKIGGLLPLRVNQSDFELHNSESRTSCSTVVLLDMSGSMARFGRFFQAKKCAMSLYALIRQRFPLDTVDLVGFFSGAERIQEERLPLLMPKRVTMFDSSINLRVPLNRMDQAPQHFTNLHLGLLKARRLLSRRAGDNKLIFVITDGQPTGHVQGDYAYLIYPPHKSSHMATLKEAFLIAQTGVRICTFALTDDYWDMDWLGFVDQLGRLTKGVTFHCASGDLSSCVMQSYLSGRKRKTFIA